MYHTIGQRQGLGIGGLADRPEAPWYVAAKDLDRNVLRVVQGNDHPALFHSRLETGAPFWIAGSAPPLPLRCAAKVRYRQPDQTCEVLAGDGGLRVDFERPQRAITPGQSVVFYDGATCLGGAVIERTL
jgi:tRNA-specific 2-thiouridylase